MRNEKELHFPRPGITASHSGHKRSAYLNRTVSSCRYVLILFPLVAFPEYCIPFLANFKIPR